MKESIGQAFIVNLIIVFFGILILLLFGSFNYSKAFKVKNRIINIIEKYGEYNDDAETEIASNMQEAGYTITNIKTSTDKCKQMVDDGIETGIIVYPEDEDKNKERYYDYCVFQYDSGIGEYYKVVVYMKFDIPLVGGFLQFPVKGETKVLYDNIDG